ncbi:MAG: YHS domain-containing protein [Chloroflexota bacterium]|nr:YHS domain-containing protein [Chloroflexota bacterium]
MDVDEAISKHTAQHDGITYYFCAPGCKKAFETEPQKYLDPSYEAHM